MTPSERLYRLLPAIYRIRDYELRSPQKQDSQKDGPLEKFLLAISQELQILEMDIGDLYENWYIETCDDWVVPYIGDLVGIRELYAASSSEIIPAGQRPYGIQERRAYVANTIAYRRRKGTASVLEQLARDVTGWGARVVEFWDLLALAQNLDHIRKQNKTVNLRSTTQLELLGTPFESETAYTIQVRPTRSGNGRYNVPHIGLYIWRLSSYPIQRGTARLVNNIAPELVGRCYSFSPLENSEIQLFNRPETETEITQLAEEINLPIRLPRRPNFEGYQGKNPVLQIFINGQTDPISPEEILITALVKPSNGQEESNGDDWLIPIPSSSQGDEPSQRTKIVAVDPQSGRIAFLDRSLPQRVEVSYSYGFSGDIGGGPYERDDDIPQLPTGISHNFSLTWEIEQATSASLNPLADAIQSWNGTLLAWQGLRNHICIPLAKITIDPINVVSLPSKSELRSFQAGIIKGLKVIAIPGTTVAVVTPGRAIDGKGRAIDINCSSSLDLSQMNLDVLPQQDVLLVVSYRAGLDNQTWQFSLIPVREFLEHSDRYPDDIYLTLAYLVLNERSEILKQDHEVAAGSAPKTVPSLPPRREFSPGKIRGLNVLTPPGALEAIVGSGIAVDDRGQVMLLSCNTTVSLKEHQGKTVWLLISYPSRSTQQTYQLDVISDADAENPERYPKKTYLRLAHLEVPIISINLTEGNAQSATQENSEQPVVVKGLQVNIGNNLGEIIVRQGKAIDRKGNTITLKQDYHLDLTSFAGQTLTLFISQQKGLGWQPLKVISLANSSEDWQQLGIVPEQPSKKPDALEQPSKELEKITKGIILIRDDATYSGNLEIKIPADRQLTIIAANGRRPHILGNLSVRGIAPVKPPETPNTIDQGELTLNGLLIEGQLAVAAGNLRWLNVSHCTLVPEQKGLMVYPSPTSIDAEDGETWNLIALVMYCINLIGKLIQTGLKSDRQPPQKLLTQLNQLAYQEAQRIFLILQQVVNRNSNQDSILEQCLCIGDSEEVIPVDYSNIRLKITILQSICGAIQLTDTIPDLEIADSIIDCGSKMKGLTAIAAPQTQVNIATTTVFGRTTAGNLEASDCIFDEPVTVTRRQKGCMRFCYVPDGSQTPPRYRCQPDLALEEALEPIPKAIASLAIEKSYGQLFAGTAGEGIYHSLNRGENWIKIENPEIAAQHITSLIANAETLAGTITSQGTTVTGRNSAFTKVFQKGDVIIAHNQVRTVDDILSDTNLTVNASFEGEALLPETSFSIPHQGKGKINSDRVTLSGQGTAFTTELKTGDTIVIEDQERNITNIISNSICTIDSPLDLTLNRFTSFNIVRDGISLEGTGKIIGVVVKGSNTAFTSELQEGDMVIAADQIRTITSIQSDTQVTIDYAFETKLEKTPFFLPYRVHGTISSTTTTIKGENTTFTKVFQVGDVVIANNQIRTITDINSDRELIIDCAFKDYSFRNVPIKFWLRLLMMDSLAGILFLYESLRADLAEGTPFFIPGRTYIFAGTSSGEVWFSPGRIENWQQVNTGSNNTAITDLVTYAPVGKGTISSAMVADNSDRVQIIGNKTAFQTELAVGDTITAAEQTRTVLKIISDTELNIDRPFQDTLPLGTTFRINHFLAGTAGNGVFRFRQRGQNWHPLNQGLTNLNITALAIGKNQQIFAGTAGGGVWRFPAAGNSWEAVNCGLSDLQVTAIAIDEEGTIFVGTEVGGVFVSTDNGDRWSTVDGSPVNLKVTALIAYSPKGIEPRLIVATAGGGIFTTTSDSLDQQETENLSILNITTMVRGTNKEQIFAGTSLGSILSSQNRGTTWITRDRSLVNVEQKLALLAQLQPNFTFENYGASDYAQLGQACPPQIYTGAEDGSEMGVFSYLKQPQRQQNLETSLDDYLRFGLEKSIFYIT